METELIGDGRTPEEPEDDASVPGFHKIGPYRVLQQLGEGGMGVVHLALDGRGKAVAVKVLRPHVADDPDARARLAREVETLGRVRSPRVAPVFDADLEADQPYIVTRYVPGPSLDAKVRDDGPLGPDELLRLARGLTEALAAIHEVGVVHRDLKPGNVLLLDGDPVVIDFGIAHVAEASRMTMTGLVMGTPGYLSPEIVEGADVGPETDWWAWAATLVHASTGRPPFGRGGMEAVLARVCRGDADLRDVDPGLAPLLHAALDPDPARRPRSPEVLTALEAYAQGRPVTEALPSRSRVMPTQQPAGSTRVLPAEQAAPPARPQTDPWGGPVHPAYQAVPPPAPRPAPAPLQPRPGSSAWPMPGPDRQGDPRIGRARRSDVLAAALAALVALTAVAPLVALTVGILFSLVARTVDRSMTATVMRRHRQGVRRSDTAMAVAASPWHVVMAALATLLAMIFPLVVGGCATVAVAVLQSLVDGFGVRLGSPLPLAAGGLVAALVGWFGPASPSLRRGSRSLARGATPSSPMRWAVVGVLVGIALLLVGAILVDGLDVSWWPLAESPLPDATELPGR
ncbi:hypothetical protein GCM10027055_03510 [Janibacter alkaliphilus]|uniref:Serine/threonine protein kinase n=1 Tax=Janibacter alkaliphilus TaxID=1069963 RepID=A0A852XEN0_9MICO|nr:serine/threonine-protein kinase [Janibacter alkaliphilus]NYG36965.1 serine/threonine protein kinase [Janibacter alkaliphilus]